jgi:hypothetical protein
MIEKSFNLRRTKSELGAQRPAEDASHRNRHELDACKTFNIESLAGRYARSSDFVL